MGDRETRIARTEALFRDVNERIAESAERVPATLDEYEEVRSDGTHFLLTPGHEVDEVERGSSTGHRGGQSSWRSSTRSWPVPSASSIRAPTRSDSLQRDEARVIELGVDQLNQLRRRR